jgi:hypothetical protein
MNNASSQYGCPPLMSDGRLYTSYRPSCAEYNALIDKSQMTSFDQRQYINKHGKAIKQKMHDDFVKEGDCSSKYRYLDINGNDAYWYAYQNKLFGNKTISDKK